jgi:hypothetical protein
MMAETSARGLTRLGVERNKADRLIWGTDAKGLPTAYREAQNVINQAVNRENEALGSVRFFMRPGNDLDKILASRLKRVEDLRQPYLKEVDESYELRCSREKVAPQKPGPSKDEIRLSGLVPVRTKTMGDVMSFWELRSKMRKSKYQPPMSIMMAEFELRNFIDNRRTVTEIRDAVSAEYGPLSILDVEKYMKFLQELGMIEIKKK